MRIRAVLVFGLLLTFAAAAGCGDEDGGGVASAGDATASSGAEDSEDRPEDAFEEALAYSECMRDNGIEQFPDPEQNDGGGVSLGLDDSVDPNSKEFKDAEAACEDLRPGAGDGDVEIPAEDLEAMREYSQCMRDNGVKNFPDPSAEGGLKVDGNELDVEMDSPEFLAAEEACQDLMPHGPESSNNSEEE